MDSISEFFQYLLNSEDIIRTGGLIVLAIVIFVESGLFFGFFLPGDYLVFLAGVFAGTKILDQPIALILLTLFGAAVLGSTAGYYFGKYFGDWLKNRPNSWIFKQENIDKTKSYFDRYGNRTLIISRFLPVVRTFAPIIAGIVRMNFGIYLLYNIIGAALWIGLLTGGGYYFGEKYPGIVNYVEYIIFFFLAVTTFAVVKGYINTKRSAGGKSKG